MGQSLFIIEISRVLLRDASDKTWPVSRNCNWYFYTGNTRVEFQKNSRLSDTFFEHSVSWFWKYHLLRLQNLGNRSGKNKCIHFSKQFQKGNRILSTTKLPLQASQVNYKWCWFSSMMSTCTFYIQSNSFSILLLDFNNFYFFVLIC